MEKQRIEKRKENKELKKRSMKERFVKFFVLFLCCVLSVYLIYMADQSIKGMMMATDDMHAIGVFKADKGLIRIDIAGEKYFVKVDKVMEGFDVVKESVTRCTQILWRRILEMERSIKDKI